MITIIDYGSGNTKSVTNAFEAIGEETFITNNPEDLKKAKGIVLPGVGAFGQGMKTLKTLGLDEALREEVVENKKPYLGICLGLQFLADKSYEHGEHEGFGWIEGEVRHIKPASPEFRTPHIGWNDAIIKNEAPLFVNFEEDPVYYFVHGLHFDVADKQYISSTVWHGQDLTASVQKDNIFGVQFHPEKSQKVGLDLLRNFIKYIGDQDNAKEEINSCSYSS